MFNYAFTVDKELKIRSWNSGLEHFKKNNFKDVEGLPYFVVLPRLWNGETDAVAQVINNRQAVRIRNYQICCFYETGAIDLFIRPLFDGQTVNGAEIEISSYQGCILYHKLLRFQPLIDVGKVSMSLAHGVRNPLNAIKGAVVYLLEKYNEEPTLVEFTSIIEQEIEKLDSFITKFLSNSLIELEFLPTDINCLLKKIIALTTLQAALKNIAFVSELAEIPLLKADSFHLEHAVLNIVNNSIESMAQGGTITFKTSFKISNDIEFVIIEISDTGPGIAGSGMTDMLYPMKGKRGDRGKGFGFFIIREIIQFHGGQLELKSRKNRGTSIKIHLPIER